MIESKKYSRLSKKIHPMRINVAHGREGIFQLKYAGGMQRRNPIQEKTVKGISGMVCRASLMLNRLWKGRADGANANVDLSIYNLAGRKNKGTLKSLSTGIAGLREIEGRRGLFMKKRGPWRPEMLCPPRS